MPTAFISYSWDSDAHRDWVRSLATDLRNLGVDAWLDQWELQLGDDVTSFMEHGISEADYVLLICTDLFAGKANARRSGVGYEQAIVTAELLTSQPPRGRFVCVLRSGTPSLAIPRYMQSRLYVDLRADDQYRRGLEQLTSHLFGRYKAHKPPLGASAPETHPTSGPSEVATAKPRGWVLVAGTGVLSDFTPALAEASMYLGSRLATDGYGLVTGGWPGVDETVARAFADTLSRERLALEDRLIQTAVEGEEPAFPAGQLMFIKRGKEEWSEPIRQADVVVLLGGLGGTWTTGEMAWQMQKPVLPLADSGGDAKKIYLRTLKEWNNFLWMGFERGQFLRLARAGHESIDAALELLAIACGHGPD